MVTKMTELDKSRKKIEEIDKKMATLFEERMAEAKKIALYKKENNLPIENKSREDELIKKNSSYVDSELKDYYISFLKNEIELSKSYQKSLNSNLNVTCIDAPQSYDVVIKRGSISHINDYFNIDRKVLVISDDNIPKKYIDMVLSQLKDGYLFTFKEGEESKNIDTYKQIEKTLLDNNFKRRDAIIALGGGVTGDLAAFSASTYMRGIDFYNIPSSLLSMVDSSIGGKTGIDYEGVKNIIGTFYQPKGVLIDADLLYTLDKREFYSGLVEAIKMAATFDSSLFSLIENSTDIMSDIDEIIVRSLEIKRMVVSKDTKEASLRSVLNFGHTIGHAIEALSNGLYKHGEAVALGMMYCSSGDARKRIKNVLEKYNLKTLSPYKAQDLMPYIIHDKKGINDEIKVIRVDEIGSYKISLMSYSEVEKLL